MATLARWQATIVDESGNVQPLASVEVRLETPGQPLVALFSDRDGLVSIGNPFLADVEGFAAFHVAGGAYKITATLDGFTRVWRYVGIGRNSEADPADDLLLGVSDDDIRRFGAVSGSGTLVTGAAISAAYAVGNSVTIPPGFICSIGQIIFQKNFYVRAYGATINLVGDKAGFVFKSLIIAGVFFGGAIVGDSANRDADPSLAQIGILVGNEPGANVSGILIKDVFFTEMNVGVKVAAGTGGGSGPSYNVKVDHCIATNIIGIVGGTGYGFQWAQAPGGMISNSTAANCQRHGIYFSEGRNYTAVNCLIKDHRSTIMDGLVRGGMAVSRSRNITITNIVFDACNDLAFVSDVDTQGLAGENILDTLIVKGLAFKNTAAGFNDIRLGTADPDVNGVPLNVDISDFISVVKSGKNEASVSVECGSKVKIHDFLIDCSAAGASFRATTLNGRVAAAYSKNIEIYDYQVNGLGVAAVQIESNILLGTERVVVRGGRVSGGIGEIEFVGGEASITNPNLLYQREADAVPHAYPAAGGATSLRLATGGVVDWGKVITATEVAGVLALAGATAYKFNAALLPTAVGPALGSAALPWAGAFFPAGGAINWANGGITVTEASDDLLHAGATLYKFDAPVVPTTSGAATVGTAALPFAGAFFTGTGPINFGNGNVVLTPSADALTLSGGEFIVNGNASSRVFIFNAATYVYGSFQVGGTNIGDIGSSNALFGGGLASDFGFNVRGANRMAFGSADVVRFYADANGIDVIGEARCDTLRIDGAAATGAALVSTHKKTINIDGTLYSLMLVAV